MKKIMGRGVLLSTLLFFSFMGYAQEWQVVRENAQKSFHKTVPAGNYSVNISVNPYIFTYS